MLEEGFHSLSGGENIEVGSADVTHRWTQVFYQNTSWTSPPLVVTQSQTVNGAEAIVTRLRNISQTGFAVKVQEQEANLPPGWHAVEKVGYVAVE